MLRKLLALIAIAVVVWLGARYFVHRGEVKATVVFHDAHGLRKGDPVVENGQTIGRVTSVTPLEGDDAVGIRLDRAHRREVVTDSLFSVENHRLVVTNTVAIGNPIEDGAVLRAKADRLSRWLARHADSVQPLLEKVKRAADRKFDSFDAELAAATAQVPQWKRDGQKAFDQHVGELRKHVKTMEDDLERSDKVAEAKRLQEKFEHWLQEARR